jgi:hypothetical protein
MSRLRDAFVRVLAVVRLARRHENGDFLETGGQGALEALRVRHQRGERDPLGHPSALDQLVRVGKLRYPAGRDEARQLDAREPRPDQRFQQLQLALERDRRRFVL